MTPTPIRQSVAKPFTIIKLAPIFCVVGAALIVATAILSALNIVVTAAVGFGWWVFAWLATEREPHIQTILLNKIRRATGLPVPPSYRFPTLRTRNRWPSDDARFLA